jgi:purine-binding chemotaxis protein CheW
VSQAQTVGSDEGVLVVQIGAEYIGLPLELIVDVDALERFPITPVPVAPQYLLGQLNWRGEILPLLELGGLLQIPPLPRQEMVIVQVDKVKMCIGVDRIFDVLYLGVDRIEELPMSMSGQKRGYLRGVAKYQDGLMYLLKLQELVQREFLPVSV